MHYISIHLYLCWKRLRVQRELQNGWTQFRFIDIRKIQIQISLYGFLKMNTAIYVKSGFWSKNECSTYISALADKEFSNPHLNFRTLNLDLSHPCKSERIVQNVNIISALWFWTDGNELALWFWMAIDLSQMQLTLQPLRLVHCKNLHLSS